ncbi:MAG TPA: MtrB/PioB family outer membrane beta-barrel protein [Thermoanaerobaculia bacterium]|nr:MtrB/PioB family outer membrane beta-barrel protein [Thermoanaerobaculia bacterium]
MRSACCAALLLFIAAASGAADDLPFFGEMRFGVTAAAQGLDLRTHNHSHPYKHDEHADTPEGFALDELLLGAADLERRSFLALRALDAGQHDQQVAAALGVFGTWRAEIVFEGFPRLFTRTARSPFAYLGNGRLVVDEAIRRELEAAAGEELARSARRVATQAPLSEIRFQRNRLTGRARWQPREWLEVRVTARDEMRNGWRPFSLGSFDVMGTPGDPRFAILMFEFAEPVESRTDEVTVGTTIRGATWHVDLDGSATRFRNTIAFIDYDNPFRVTHQAATPDGLSNRMRASRGHVTSAPNTTGHSLRASGHFDLGTRAHVGASLGWIGMRQDQRFVPWTLNLAIPGSGLPEGLGPTNHDALPRDSLGGRASVLSTDDSLAVTLTNDLTLTLRYRDYDFSNDTPELPLPGYAGFGDSVWRTEFAGSPIVAVGRSFRRQSGESDLVWRRGPLRARFTHEREIWTREHRQSGRTEQDSVTAAVQLRAGEVSGRTTLRHRRRNGTTLAGRDALRFDTADLRRTDIRAHAQWTPSERAGVTAALNTLWSAYGTSPEGLQQLDAYDGTIAVRLSIFAAAELTARLSRDAMRYDYAHAGVAPVPERWGRDVNDRSTTAGLDFGTSLGPLTLHAGYERATGTQSIVMLTGAARDELPRVRTNQQRIRAEMEMELTPRWHAGLRYRYAPFSIDDYATNDLSFYPLDAFSPEMDARRVFLLDARYADHEVHVLALYFRLASR